MAAESLNEWVVVGKTTGDEPTDRGSSCHNHPGEAQLTIQLLLEENALLRERIAELEDGVDGTLKAIEDIERGLKEGQADCRAK
ncbi:hypothetical protein N0V93_010276 [Gnomoniopsis smithogilvyi]|uniref:Uncharacterized protein n=1 Tax=Gnomoniopsis smithogilvyi TaxID=1191159 RepID=A0A9W9CRS3_9PEZI|nr:hypothetical protein N0V93_010276 [Gnomoniopsis smithogilvyi]